MDSKEYMARHLSVRNHPGSKKLIATSKGKGNRVAPGSKAFLTRDEVVDFEWERHGASWVVYLQQKFDPSGNVVDPSPSES